ncbi:MAG: family 10 glycosylhydrolase [Bacteroidaceae bacterium]|nr:S-layer protein [Bacteroides sp.]MBQ4589479.1 family 10 glycosylhydrolase [Bacteroidaceae bacterium]
MRTFLLIFISLLFITIKTAAQPKCEIRATWITTLGGMDWPRNKATNANGIRRQQQELRDILDQLKKANFNTVMLQTRLRGDLIYPSAFETFPEALTGKTGRNPGYDPLAFAIEECHKRGMELHAWIVTIPVGNHRQIKLLDKYSVVRKNRKICKQYQGSWYLDPGHPGTADYLAGIVREIVSRYDVDGVHFDYIRYPENARRFPDKDTHRKYGKGKDLKQWRRENITAIARRLHAEVKQLKPWVKVSSSPVGKFKDTNRYSSFGWNAYETVYQDAQGWLKEGIHDALFPMMYFKDNHFYPFALDWKENDNGRWVVPGLGIYFLSPKEQDWPIDEVSRQLHFTRQTGLAGHAYFRNRFLLDNVKGIFDELKNDFYTTPALVPPMTWQDNIAPTAPTEPFYELQTNGEVKLAWSASKDNHDLPVVYHLYASSNYPVDTNNANNLLATYLKGNQITLPDGEGYFAVTAADRYGNESAPLALNTAPEVESPTLNQGNKLVLPQLEDVPEILICNALGETISKVSYQPEISLKLLPEGFYLVYTWNEEGEKKFLGTILK